VSSTPVAWAKHDDPRWKRSDCAGPFNCDIPNPSCKRGSAGCSRTKSGKWRINKKSQRFDIPGTNKDRWAISLPTGLYDGFGRARDPIVGHWVHINYGQRKNIGGKDYVWAHSARIAPKDPAAEDYASGWVPQASIRLQRPLALMPNVLAEDPGHGDIATDYQVTFARTGKFGNLKVVRPKKGHPVKREQAADYLEREGVVYLNYSLPGNGGYAIDALPEDTPFRRARKVKAAKIKLYRPLSREQVKTMAFVYGHIVTGSVRRYGWIALDALSKPRRCGNYGNPGDGKPRWTYRRVYGFYIVNVTSLGVGCDTARRVVRHAFESYTSGPRWKYREWDCRILSQKLEYQEVLCTKSGGRVVRWTTGA